ncbi:hypothetical protein [Sphingomonas pituitosa]|uniref:hypothetical protein n=1 Tax=Sphingomonas pituitosa TaxID=99597 RepID=UPI000ABBF1D2|nr:hypothetical protein [Sphingomonas pituitosa]
MRHGFTSAVVVLMCGIGPYPAAAQDTPRDLQDLVGARGGQAEAELGRRGYAWVRTESGPDRKWSSWWNAGTRSCATITTKDGRYAAIVASPPSACASGGQEAGNRPRPGGPPLGERPREQLTLICWGEGQKPGSSYRSGYVWNDRTHRYESYSAVESGTQRFDSTVQVELWGDGGRIRLAGKLIPPIHSGGRDGWWDLDDVRMTRDRITAQYRLNGLNKPRVDIDRRIGRIAIDGIEKFRGSCDQGDWSGSRNKF